MGSMVSRIKKKKKRKQAKKLPAATLTGASTPHPTMTTFGKGVKVVARKTIPPKTLAKWTSRLIRALNLPNEEALYRLMEAGRVQYLTGSWYYDNRIIRFK